MRADGVAKAEMAAKTGPVFRHAGMGVQIELLVFDAAPQPLDEDIVAPGSFPVHAGLDAMARQHAGKFVAGDPGTSPGEAAWDGIEDFGLAISGDGLLDRLDASPLCRFSGPPLPGWSIARSATGCTGIGRQMTGSHPEKPWHA